MACMKGTPHYNHTEPERDAGVFRANAVVNICMVRMHQQAGCMCSSRWRMGFAPQQCSEGSICMQQLLCMHCIYHTTQTAHFSAAWAACMYKNTRCVAHMQCKPPLLVFTTDVCLHPCFPPEHQCFSDIGSINMLPPSRSSIFWCGSMPSPPSQLRNRRGGSGAGGSRCSRAVPWLPVTRRCRRRTVHH